MTIAVNPRDLETDLRDLVARSLNQSPEQLSERARIDGWDLDSLEWLELTFAIERRYHVVLPPPGNSGLTTFGELLAAVKAQYLAQPRPWWDRRRRAA